jgi:hypothetical protein
MMRKSCLFRDSEQQDKGGGVAVSTDARQKTATVPPLKSQAKTETSE